MALIVQKYGGSSVSDVEAIKRVAKRIVETRNAGHKLVVVVSAMGDTTDELLDTAAQITDNAPEREMDILLTAGERISMSLLSMAINELGVPAQAFTGAQAGIHTTSAYGRAQITGMVPERVARSISEGQVAIVAGFQGISDDDDVTTLGRGGSDTTAVALAAALHADVCEIYTDVDGLFSADPRIVPKAHRLRSISTEETLEAPSNSPAATRFLYTFVPPSPRRKELGFQTARPRRRSRDWSLTPHSSTRKKERWNSPSSLELPTTAAKTRSRSPVFRTTPAAPRWFSRRSPLRARTST